MMRKWMILAASAFLLTGCIKPTEVLVDDGKPNFCDVEEERRFTQEEIDWRTAHAPWNLRRDYRTNLSWEQWCDPMARQDAE